MKWTRSAVARALSVEHRLDEALYREAEKPLGANGIMDAVILTGIYHTVCAILNAFVIPPRRRKSSMPQLTEPA